MKAIMILLVMLFLHCFSDFHMQGILANMKQRSWWLKDFRSEDLFNLSPYANDYRVALWVHAFETTFVSLIPLFIRCWTSDIFWHAAVYVPVLILGVMFHAYVDHLKANRKEINLVGDQALHCLFIFVTWISWTIAIGW